MRVGICALLHESNSFVSAPTTLQHFQENWLLEGEDIRERLAGSHHEIGGMLEGLTEAGIEAVPLFAARAVPFGVIEDATYRELLRRMLAAIDRAEPLDGVLVAPHGATVSEEVHDVDGDWLSHIRRRVGDRIPIIGTLDPHANLSPQMVRATNALIAYRTNPHLDQRARGREAAGLLARTLQGEIRPVQRAEFPPIAINIERQRTDEAPCRPWYELADHQLARPDVLSNSLLLGFPYSDVAKMGSSVLAVTDGSEELAQECAAELARHLWVHRDEFSGQLKTVEDTVSTCAKLNPPVCLLDMGDNVGGGSPADSTHLAHALHRMGVRPSFICLYDPWGAREAAAARVGSRLRMKVGGKTDSMHGEPFEDEFQVVGIYDGKFTEPEPRHGGFGECDQGLTAVLAGDSGLTVMLTSRRMPPFSLRQLTTFDVDPRRFQAIVAKGVHAPVAAYQSVCKHLLRVNTPGCTTADMTQLPFCNRRRPLFPFERSEARYG